MPSFRSAATILGLAALLGVAGGVARADPPAPRAAPPQAAAADREQQQKQAMALHDEAWALYEDGHYRAAIEKLEAALRIDPEGKELVYNLALLHEKLADVKQAEAYYRRYLEMETDPRTRTRTQATLRRLEGVEKETAAAPVPPAPPPAPPPPPRPVRPWVVATGSVAGIAFLMGSVFGLNALSKDPGARRVHRPGRDHPGSPERRARRAHRRDRRRRLVPGHARRRRHGDLPLPLHAQGALARRAARRSLPAGPAPSVAVGPGLLRVTF